MAWTFEFKEFPVTRMMAEKGLLLRELRDGMTRRWIVVEDLSEAMILRKALGMTDRARAEGL
ncbi:hypothetical protein Pmar_PMAR012141 [Perkinsus marinus ATCC 50983]|uniref:Uncharacterized protein n=1 Tax=Perkinsus marinus (strain ATCC 50983 / TXsc) TaxID=423536 RepID=C5KR45_PERM5|nr:hypothetical protein Pmar_PMAR012141 [Perkinsus marinus ATCC 50983]EER13049.1 hypothetical protein Pmar_PMAR012141 [Perkinsus marinus ATCC 50983]|eukprot:XP_002781254.1 hypothetical protein Pmar_PMAR012141 [Perkinsus marinus ATCC 50983]